MAVNCPCCRRPAGLRPEVLAFAIGATGLEARVLAAVWRGKGQPVHHAQIIRAMYDPDDEGPVDRYSGFKVTLCLLRKKLRGTGYAIKNVHYDYGYRLVNDQDRQEGDAAFRAEPVTAGAECRAGSVTAHLSPF